MTNYETGAVRDTGGKGRMDLLPMCALLRISRHMEDANTHYPERNWEKGLPMHSMIDSAFRHLVKYMDGQMDEDHLCAAATNLLMALWTEEKRPEMQDIPARIPRGSGDASPYARRAASLASDGNGGVVVPHERGVQGKAKEKPPVARCRYYDSGRCLGTKEMDTCEHFGRYDKCEHGKPPEDRVIRAKIPPDYE